MTRYKKIEAEKIVRQMFCQKIVNQGFFDLDVDRSRMIPRIAYEAKLSRTFVERIYYKKFRPNNKDFLDFYEC